MRHFLNVVLAAQYSPVNRDGKAATEQQQLGAQHCASWRDIHVPSNSISEM